MKLAHNVEMLEIGEAGNKIYPVLTWDDAHLVLFDAGFPNQAEEFSQAISDLGFSIENLTEIILTHQDLDHIGSLNAILKLAPNAKVMALEEEIPYIDGTKIPTKLAKLEGNLENLTDRQKEIYHYLKSGFAFAKAPVDVAVTDGETLPISGGLAFIHTPGHTPGHMSILLEESGILIGGDAVNIQDGELIGSNPVYMDKMDLAEKSLEKIKNLDVKGIVTYHTGYWER
ncbi:MAG: MBL fold metallo-hydrolase [Turicibacter sp.]|nr:MBL fold metallo-hydrolase [Turicibacter sp.]